MGKTVLVVDDEPNNLQVLRQILKDSYNLIFANGGYKAIEVAKTRLPDLILLDIMMPDLSGYDVCKEIKRTPETQDIPIIFVTAMSDIDDEAQGFDVGAVDYIQKPVSPPIVKRRIETHLSLVKAKELEQSHREAIYMLGEAGHYNDNDTGVHIWRMAAYCKATAIELGWTPSMCERLCLAAPMHDTGKIGIPDSILKAPRKLTEDEWVVMKRHASIGAEILRKCHSPIFQMAADIAQNHHEKWDGTGYPEGIAGEDIPESARIVAVCDVFDALTMKRPYKSEWPVDKAVKEIMALSNTHFDPKIVEAFHRALPEILKLREGWNKKNSDSISSQDI